jgi:hypothetical protein
VVQFLSCEVVGVAIVRCFMFAQELFLIKPIHNNNHFLSECEHWDACDNSSPGVTLLSSSHFLFLKMFENV